MKVLVLLSGGCESTALLQHGRDKGYELHAVHASFSNATVQEIDSCRSLCKHYKIPFHVSKIDNTQFNKANTKTIAFDIAYWLPIAAICSIVSEEFDQVWFGIHSKDNLPLVGKVQVIFNLLKTMSYRHSCKTTIEAPLSNLTKKEQYNIVPKELRSKIVYCWENKNNPCGKCKKCVEWKEQGLSR